MKTGLIYKICIKDASIDDCYIGSTYNTIYKRKGQHKAKYNNNVDRPLYNTIRNNGGWDNWDFIIIDKLQFEDEFELRKKEREHIELIKPTLNKLIPTRTHDERKETDEFKKYQIDKTKKWRENNQDKYKQKIICDICKTELLKWSMNRHIKRKHDSS